MTVQDCGCIVFHSREGWDHVQQCDGCKRAFRQKRAAQMPHESWCAAPFNVCSCDFDGIRY